MVGTLTVRLVGFTSEQSLRLSACLNLLGLTIGVFWSPGRSSARRLDRVSLTYLLPY
ncbi:unnamed protein product, partial [Protopolystoma xenopodis]